MPSQMLQKQPACATPHPMSTSSMTMLAATARLDKFQTVAKQGACAQSIPKTKMEFACPTAPSTACTTLVMAPASAHSASSRLAQSVLRDAGSMKSLLTTTASVSPALPNMLAPAMNAQLVKALSALTRNGASATSPAKFSTLQDFSASPAPLTHPQTV